MSNRVLGLVIGCVCVLSSLPCASQDFPVKPVRVIVANSPGTVPDILVRAMLNAMSKALGQAVVVEYKQNALIGFEHVATQSPADGYTVLSAPVGNFATLPLTSSNLRFNPLKDLPPVLGLAEGRFLLSVPSKVPWNTFNELIAYAKANPGKLNYGYSAPIGQLTTEGLLRDAGVNILGIAYRAADSAQAIAAGDIHLYLFGDSNVISLGDKVRVIAVTGERRHAKFPSVPTFAELGYPRVPGITYSLNVRAGTPKAAFDKLHAAASEALKQPEVEAAFAKIHLQVTNEPPEAAVKRLESEAVFFADVAKKIGLKPQ